MADIEKVVCYVTRSRGASLDLLVFDHRDDPEAGTQVPAGTVDPGEAPDAAADRELFEETGLRDLPRLGMLDARGWMNPASGNLHLRRVYHYHAEAAPDAWDHVATGSSDENGKVFRCRWLPIEEARRVLAGGFGRSIELLLAYRDHKPVLRAATFDDLAAINDIYNHYVPRSTCTYQETDEPIGDRRVWFESRGPMHPVKVIELGGTVVAWGSLNVFRARTAYRFTTENSIYVRHDLIGRGLGRLLLADQIRDARHLGHRVIIAGIDAEQPASIRLHERFGFVQSGYLKEVGFKFGRWLDVVFLQKNL